MNELTEEIVQINAMMIINRYDISYFLIIVFFFRYNLKPNRKWTVDIFKFYNWLDLVLFVVKRGRKQYVYDVGWKSRVVVSVVLYEPRADRPATIERV